MVLSFALPLSSTGKGGENFRGLSNRKIPRLEKAGWFNDAEKNVHTVTAEKVEECKWQFDHVKFLYLQSFELMASRLLYLFTGTLAGFTNNLNLTVRNVFSSCDR